MFVTLCTVSDVRFSVVNVTSGFVIFPGVGSPERLLDTGEPDSQNRLLLLQQKIAQLLDTSLENVDIISVRNAADAPGSVDVTYAAHGSPYYTPEKLDTVVWMNRQDVSITADLYGKQSSCNALFRSRTVVL